MSIPYQGDSDRPDVPGITGKNSAGGIGVRGESTGGVAGFFDGDVAVTRNITVQDILLEGAQPNGQGLVAQLQNLVPVGCIVAFAGNQIASQTWKLCNGKSVSKGEFPELFAAINTTWGGDGNPNFNLPDLQGRFPLGAGSGGVWKDANDPSLTFPLSARKLGEASGEEKHKLTIPEMPSHAHPVYALHAGHQPQPHKGGAAPAQSDPYYDIPLQETSVTGGDNQHSVMPPFLVINYIIKVR